MTNPFQEKPAGTEMLFADAPHSDEPLQEMPPESAGKARMTIGELTEFQLIYLACYVFAHFAIFFVGPLLLFFNWDDDLSFCIGIGLLHGVAINSAAWSVLADMSIFIRLPLGACVSCLCSIALLGMFYMEQDIANVEMLIFGAMPMGVFILLQAPFWLLRLAFAWRVRFSRPALIPDKMQVRFSMRHLFIAVTVAAVLMGGIRGLAFLLADVVDHDMLFALYLVLAAAGIGVVTVVCCLVNRQLPPVLLGGAFLNIIVTGIELVLCAFTLRLPGNDFIMLIATINIATMAVVAASFLTIRPVGLRLWTISDSAVM